MKFAVYSRKSIITNKGDSIGNQIELCRKHITDKYPTVTDSDITIYQDEGYSGKSIDRPRFQALLSDIRDGRIDCVVCYRLDRISRSVGDFAKLLDEFTERNITFISINESFDTSTPMGRAMMSIASVFAQLERETLAERVRDNMYALARKGQWLGGTPPTGFEAVKAATQGETDVFTLKPVAEEIEHIKIIFDKFLEIGSMAGVVKFLISQGIKSRNGNDYKAVGLKDILQNPVYCAADKYSLDYFIENNADVCFSEDDCTGLVGLLAYNKHDKSKKNQPRNSIDKWVVAMGRHKAVVSGEKWVAVQRVLESRKESRKPSTIQAPPTHNDYALLSGLIKCGKCGESMFSKRRRNNPDLFDYICEKKARGNKALCDCPNLNGLETDDLVCEHLSSYTKTDSSIYKLLEKLKSEIGDTENPRLTIERNIRGAEERRNNYIKSLSHDLTPAVIAGVNENVAKLDAELERLQQELMSITSDNKELQVESMAWALALLKNVKNNTMSIHEKRQLIRLLIEKIKWDGEDIHIFIYGEGE